MRDKLRDIIDDNTTVKGRIFDYIIQLLILTSLIAYAIETVPDNSAQTKQILKWIEVVSIIIFSIEYILRVYVAKNPLKYIFSFLWYHRLFSNSPFFLKYRVGFNATKSFQNCSHI